MVRPGGHVHQNAGLLGCQDRLHLEVAAGLQRKDRSQLGLAQAIAEAEQVLQDNDTMEKIKAVLRRWSSTWVGVFKSGEGFELRKSAEDKPREVDPFREEKRVATKTARVCGRGRTACFLVPKGDKRFSWHSL